MKYKFVVSKISFRLGYKNGFKPNRKSLAMFRVDLKKFVKSYSDFLQSNTYCEEDIVPTRIKVRAKQFND